MTMQGKSCVLSATEDSHSFGGRKHEGEIPRSLRSLGMTSVRLEALMGAAAMWVYFSNEEFPAGVIPNSEGSG